MNRATSNHLQSKQSRQEHSTDSSTLEARTRSADRTSSASGKENPSTGKPKVGKKKPAFDRLLNRLPAAKKPESISSISIASPDQRLRD
ncbi:MAG: hypothetical protein ACI841_000715 [Planctomycetota bacterium]|jgi:hypothetical protein